MWYADIDWADEKHYAVVIDDVGHQRGTYSKAHRRYACIKPSRNAPQQFAWQSTRSKPWALEYYQRKRWPLPASPFGERNHRDC